MGKSTISENMPTIAPRDRVAPETPLSERPLVPNGIYTISNIYRCPSDDELMLELFELPEVETDWWWPGFKARYFRPVRETSIEQFRGMLAPHDLETV